MTRPEAPAWAEPSDRHGLAGNCGAGTRPRTCACLPPRRRAGSSRGETAIRNTTWSLAWELLYRLEPELYDRLASAERLHPGVVDWLPRDVDRIVEVGAGTGRLTIELIERGRRVVAVEPALPLRRILQPEARCGGSRRPGPADRTGSSTSCRCPTISPTWSSPAPPSPPPRNTAARQGWPRWSGYAGRADAWPSSGRTTSTGSPTRGYRYVSFPGPMSVEFGSYREAVELAEIFYPQAADEVRRHGWRRVPFEVLGINPPRDWPIRCSRHEDRDHGSAGDGYPRAAARRFAGVRGRSGPRPGRPGARRARLRRIRIRDPGRRADRHRSGSPRRWLARSTGRPGQPRATQRSPTQRSRAAAAAAESAFATAFAAMRSSRYDVIHNHAFDAPAVRLGTALRAPVVHTLHLPPDRALSAALRDVARRGRPPAVAVVSNSRPSPGAGSCPSTRSCRRTRPHAISLVRDCRAGRAVRGPAEPGEGRGRGHRHRPRGWSADRCLRRRL